MSNNQVLPRIVHAAGPSFPFFVALAVALLTLVAAQFVPLLDQDEMIYALVARDLLDGMLPYQGSFDHKPVAVYYLYAFFFFVFGENFVAIRIMAALLLLGSTWNVYRGLKTLGFSREATIAAAITCLAIPMGLDGMAGNTEIMLTFCLSLLFLLASKVTVGGERGWVYWLLFGAVVAVGFSINYLFSFLALFSFTAFVICLFLAEQSVTSLLTFAVLTVFGFVIGLVLVFSPYLLDLLKGGDLLAQYFDDQSKFHQGYGGSQLAYAFLMHKVFVWIVPFVPIIIGAAFSAFVLNAEKRLTIFLASASFLAAMISSSVSTMFFNHYWIMSTVAYALFAAITIEACKNKEYGLAISYIHGLILCIYIASGWGRIISHHLNIGGAYELNRASAFISETVPPDATVAGLSVSPAHIFLNKLDVQQKYQFEGHVYQLHDHGKLDGDAYFINELAKAPQFLLVSPLLCVPPRSEVFVHTCNEIEQRYEFLASFEGERPVYVYRKKMQNI